MVSMMNNRMGLRRTTPIQMNTFFILKCKVTEKKRYSSKKQIKKFLCVLTSVNKTCKFTNNFLLFVQKYCENEIKYLLLQARM